MNAKLGCSAVVVVLGLAAIGSLIRRGGSDRSIEPGAPSGASRAQDSLAAPRPAVIPDLLPVDVYGNLTNKGFAKIGPTSYAGSVLWSLEKQTAAEVYSVEIYGSDATSVRRVNAISAALRGGGDGRKQAREFLGFVSSIEYAGSDPAKAREWVESHVGENPASTTIGGVTFELENTGGTAYMLRIVPVD